MNGSNKEKEIIEKMNRMCEESLCPESFEAWCKICAELYEVRANLKTEKEEK